MRLVRDVSDRDRYNRLLRYVYIGKTFVNAELVRLGHARPMAIAPNVKHKALFSRLRKAARKPCKDFVELLVKDLRRRARREERKSSEWAERFMRLAGRAMVKDITPAECAAAVKAGLPDPKTLAKAMEGLMKVLGDE